MQREKQHMRIVIDEYGSVAGLVTIEDLLEAIVGNIADEHDEPEVDDEPIREPNGAYVVSGSFELSRLRDLFADQFEQNHRATRPAEDSEPHESEDDDLESAEATRWSDSREESEDAKDSKDLREPRDTRDDPTASVYRSTTNPPPWAASSPRSPATSHFPEKSSRKTASASKFSPVQTAASTASESA